MIGVTGVIAVIDLIGVIDLVGVRFYVIDGIDLIHDSSDTKGCRVGQD